MFESFADYWARKQRANVPLREPDGKLTLDNDSFRKELEKAFDAGAAYAAEAFEAKAASLVTKSVMNKFKESVVDKLKSGGSTNGHEGFRSLFEQIFGGNR